MAINLKDKKIKSLQYKTTLTFSMFSIFIIVFMWVFQAIYFSIIFENVKANEIEYIASSISKIYKKSNNYEETLLNLSHQKDVGIIIFNMENEEPHIVFNSSRETAVEPLKEKLISFVYNMGSAENARFVNKTQNNIKMLSCGKSEYIDGKLTYFCISAPITPVTTTTKNFNYLLLFISIGVFSTTLIGSYILSSQLSRPIVKMASKAKQLSNTNLNVKFSSTEYSEVKQLSDTLNYAIGELKKTDMLRKEVLANVSHELKTPLTMIKSYTELIRDISGDNPEKRKNHLDIIYSEAEKLELLINDMMDYSKLESGIMTYNKTKFNLSEILMNLKRTYSQKFTEFKITLSCPKNIYIYADKTRIEQVITNLLNNAINYSTTKKQINIRLKETDQKDIYKLEIIDHGMGISKENIPHVFERHFRSTSAKRTTVGSGIGLSIVKTILDYHDYPITVQSEENKGSSFVIVFNNVSTTVK